MKYRVQNGIAMIYAILKVFELSGLQPPWLALFEWVVPAAGHSHVSLVDAFVIMHLVIMAEHWADDHDSKKKD